MKKIILLSLILSFGYSPALLSNNNKVETSFDIRKKRLCKTWYVAKAFEIREDRPRKNRTEKAKGSTFTFNKDYSFILTDNSRRTRKPMTGVWKETGKNSFSITIKELELKFEIKKLTRDSLYIIGSDERRGNKKMHIVFSSNIIEPLEKKELNYQDLDDSQEIEVTEEIETVVEDMEIADEVPDIEVEESQPEMPEPVKEIIANLYDKEKLSKAWILTNCYVSGRNLTEEYIGTSYVFGNDLSFKLIEFHKMNDFPVTGMWHFSNNKVEVTVNGETKAYSITKLTNDKLVLKELGTYRSVYSFKSKK